VQIPRTKRNPKNSPSGLPHPFRHEADRAAIAGGCSAGRLFGRAVDPCCTGLDGHGNGRNALTPEASGPCTDDDLVVTNGPLESANTQRHVILSFKNMSSHSCTLVGYPGADLATPAGGVLINVPRRPANAAHRLTLNPGDVATADVTAYVIDTSTGDACPRWGNLVVTPPNGFVSHPMSVDVPICRATVSSVD
jgi:hypothetical protein